MLGTHAAYSMVVKCSVPGCIALHIETWEVSHDGTFIRAYTSLRLAKEGR